MQTVVGRVLNDVGVPQSAISVTNGIEVVCTDDQGQYELPLRAKTRFVHVTQPAGWIARGSFFRHLDCPSFDFVLEPYPLSGAISFSFVQVTDLHLSTERRYLPRDFGNDLDRLLGEVGDGAHFIVVTGDLTAGGRAEEYAAYVDVLSECPLPVFHAIGNHDDDFEVAGEHFATFLGPHYYSFQWGPVHFVVYDGEAWQRMERTRDGSLFGYEPSDQDEWLAADLAMRPPDLPVIVLNHFPWGSEFYDQWKNCGLVASIAGHWHSIRRYADGDMVHYSSPPLSFAGIDQSPRAYRLFTWDNNELTVKTRAMVDQNIFKGLSFAAPVPALGSAAKKGSGGQPVSGLDWPVFQGNVQRTGSIASGPQPPLRLCWRSATGGGIHMASPVVAAGLVYQATKNEDQSEGNGMVALDANSGDLRWSVSTEAAVKRAPAVAADRVFAVTVTGQVVALNAVDGGMVWSYQLGDPSQRWVYSSPLVHEGRVVVGVSSHLVALDQRSGERIWLREDLGVDDWISSYASPAALDDYLTVAFYNQPTSLAVLHASSGKILWRKDGDKSHNVYSTPVIDEEGYIYVTSGSVTRSFELESGVQRWQTKLPIHRSQATPAMATGRLFVSTAGGTMHALDAASGARLWRWDVPTEADSFTPYVRRGPAALATPVVAAGFLYFGAADGRLYVLDAYEGNCVWSYPIGAPLAAGSALSGDGLWIGAGDGHLSAFRGTRE